MGVGAILVNKPARSKDKVRVNTGGGGGFMHGGGKAALWLFRPDSEKTEEDEQADRQMGRETDKAGRQTFNFSQSTQHAHTGRR